MDKLLRHLFLAAILFSQITMAQTADDRVLPVDPNVVTGTLPNGLHYYIRKNNRPEKRAELRLAVNAGSTSEDDDQQGIAHLTEHLAFNGTANFKKNELVDYLESVGTKFGPHLNAYTSFDETVYMLQLPVDQPAILDKGLLILKDWADGLAFDSLEIEKERGVVVEEWRLGQNANERMRRKYWPVLFKNSRYAERLPIGKKEIIESSPRSTIKRFYDQWYRPDLMAIVAVGDFDPLQIEKKIKDIFSKVEIVPALRSREVFTVEENKKLAIATATDKETKMAEVEIIYKHER